MLSKIITFLSLISVCSLSAVAESGSSSEDLFLRIQKNDKGVFTAMETSIIRFAGEHASHPVEVDLVSVVHVAEPEYYQELNKRFSSYDAVLFELIAPEDISMKDWKASKKKQSTGDNPLSALQQLLQTALGLGFQLDLVDYTKANFVHADLSPETFAASMKSRGESIWSLMARILIQGFSEEQQKSNPFDNMLLLMAFATSKDTARPFVLRRYLAEHFRQLDSLVEKIEGPKGSAIVADRNAKALEVLREQLAKGKKKLAIFYGAAHMPSFRKSLERDFHFWIRDSQWLVAWKLQPTT